MNYFNPLDLNAGLPAAVVRMKARTARRIYDDQQRAMEAQARANVATMQARLLDQAVSREVAQ